MNIVGVLKGNWLRILFQNLESGSLLIFYIHKLYLKGPFVRKVFSWEFCFIFSSHCALYEHFLILSVPVRTLGIVSNTHRDSSIALFLTSKSVPSTSHHYLWRSLAGSRGVGGVVVPWIDLWGFSPSFKFVKFNRYWILLNFFSSFEMIICFFSLGLLLWCTSLIDFLVETTIICMRWVQIGYYIYLLYILLGSAY